MGSNSSKLAASPTTAPFTRTTLRLKASGRPASPVQDALVRTRPDVKRVCKLQYPVKFDSPYEDTMAAPPEDDNDVEALIKCTHDIRTLSDASSPPIAVGAYGEIHEMKGNPKVLVKIALLRPSSGARTVISHAKRTDFLSVYKGLDPTERRTIREYLAQAPELSEAIVHATLSHNAESGVYPPCVPLFIGSYVGTLKETEERRFMRKSAPIWWTESPKRDGIRPLTSQPALFLLMENLRGRMTMTGDKPPRPLMQSMVRRRCPPLTQQWLTCLFASLTSMNTTSAFVHGDLHKDNVLMCKVPGMKYMGMRILDVNNELLGVYRCRVDETFPVFIDFGLSSIIRLQWTGDDPIPGNTQKIKPVVVNSDGRMMKCGPMFYQYNVPDSHELSGVFHDISRLLGYFDLDSVTVETFKVHPYVQRKLQLAQLHKRKFHPQHLSWARVKLSALLYIAVSTWAESLPKDTEPSEDTWFYDVHVTDSWGKAQKSVEEVRTRATRAAALTLQTKEADKAIKKMNEEMAQELKAPLPPSTQSKFSLGEQARLLLEMARKISFPSNKDPLQTYAQLKAWHTFIRKTVQENIVDSLIDSTDFRKVQDHVAQEFDRFARFWRECGDDMQKCGEQWDAKQ